ncbi:hypothetical protein [Kitasatospora sp. A2-31]|uniref:hypothetical protein n=1 Tax=Kitasatospora sp. A2-31 TaxID=2916414 RepID=UPI001EEAF3DB|nr:hypothetical protein [Kitasatospora sp. A2-31]
MSSDSWPALHGRPVLRRTVAIGLVLSVAALAALAVRGVNALTLGRGAVETDRDRAELLAGLHPSQHPGAGRYYVPVGAVYTHLADGAPVAYLHYRLAGGQDVGVGDFLRTYGLPAPGPTTPLPTDLTAALGGDEPDTAQELTDAEPAQASPPATPTASVEASTATPTPTAAPSPTAVPAAAPSPTAVPAAAPSPTAVPAAAPSPTAVPAAASPEPASPSPCPGEEPSDETAAEDGDGGESVGPSPSALRSADDPEPPPPSPTATPAPTATPTATPAPTPTPVPAPAPTPVHLVPGRRIYVATIPSGLPGAADIYVRAIGG